MAKVVAVVATEFAEASRGSGLIVFDLWSADCQPCRALAPILDDLAADLAGEVAIRKVDIGAADELRDRLGVRGVPTLLLYRDGTEIDRLVGLRSRSQLMNWIESHS